MERLLGMVNYYNRFLPRIAEITVPFSEISGGSKKTNKLMLNLIKKVQAFDETKATLANAAT